MKRVVLFDFHNTLATCDAWLDLEIRTLAGRALEGLRAEGYLEGTAQQSSVEAERAFRSVRAEVRQSGIELSAVEGARRALAQMGYSVQEEALAAVVEELELQCLAEVAIVPGAHECLRQLSGAGYRLGVVSSAGFPPFVERALEMLGLRTYFSEVVTSAAEGIYKSDPRIFALAVLRLDASPAEAVHVGDHAIYDVTTARQAGLAAIWFRAEAERTARSHGADWAELERAGLRADAVTSNLADVPGIVAGL